MQPSLYVGVSAQVALLKRIEAIANNVANASTAGFRAEEVKFESLLSQTLPDPTVFVSPGITYLSRKSGELMKTDNPFDVAVNGDAWFGIQTPAGTVYTRDGRMRMLDTGELQTLEGYPVLDVGGAQILLDPNGGEPRIAQDGTVTQNNRQIGALGLFTIPETARLARAVNSGVVPDQPAAPALDFSKTGVAQGYVERANVNPVMEISKLIMLQRAFDAIAASMSDSESSMQDAIKTLGETS
ncbi:MAG TPA: flagellar basal-body rod protein FlgF [Hyphomicrobiaceae bacterium]|nr:flagellar basal-body rod protein FlgF [Hyphomicrobiaceae bacterium]